MANGSAGRRRAVVAHRHRPDVEVVLVGRGVAQPVEVVGPDCREEHLDRVGDPVERQPLEHAGQPEAVVAVEVGHADVVDAGGGRTGQQELALGPLARVEQDGAVVPAQEVAVVVAATGGGLAGRAEDDQLAGGHAPVLHGSAEPGRRSVAVLVG